VPYVPRKGDAFLVESGDRLHLHVVLTDKDRDGSHLLVSVSTIKPGARYVDYTCEIQAGEHPFVTVPSFVYYHHVQPRHANHIVKCVASGYFKQQNPINPALLDRIRTELLASDQIPKFAKKMMR
jgi:hypothetical protein